MISPLKHIYIWYHCLPTELQAEIAAEICKMHYDLQIRTAADDHAAIREILSYLKSGRSDIEEVLGKSIYMMALFDFVFSEKRTEEYWVKLQTGLNTSLQEDPGGHCNGLLATLQWRKVMWQEASKSWELTKDNHLCGKYLRYCLIRYGQVPRRMSLRLLKDQHYGLTLKKKETARGDAPRQFSIEIT